MYSVNVTLLVPSCEEGRFPMSYDGSSPIYYNHGPTLDLSVGLGDGKYNKCKKKYISLDTCMYVGGCAHARLCLCNVSAQSLDKPYPFLYVPAIQFISKCKRYNTSSGLQSLTPLFDFFD